MNEIVKIESITQVHDFLNLPKPKHPLVSVLPITDEITNYDYGDDDDDTSDHDDDDGWSVSA